jgi:Zn-dependent protease with chaperone function
MDAFPVEDVIGRPIATLLLCALVPIATARLLWITLVGRLPEGGPREEGRALAPFRTAAFSVGLVQCLLAWELGATSLGPALVEEPGSLGCEAFGALAATVAFCAGGVGRLVEEREAGRAQIRSAIALRLRLLTWLAGPLIAARLAAELPVVSPTGPGIAQEVRWGVVAGAFATCALGVAFGGLVLAIAVCAVRPANAEVRAIAEEVAIASGVRLWAVLRLPTGVARFANAVAIPWARALVVTDRIVALLAPSELRAVLAHEAAHLREGPWVSGARLGVVTLLVFGLTPGVRVADALHPEGASLARIATVALALPLVLAVRRLARRMEERADAWALRIAGPEALADALTKIHEDARTPLVSGRRRVHPDLYDRLVACGRDPGPRPAPPRRAPGIVAALAIAGALMGAVWIANERTAIPRESAPLAGAGAARWRLRVDPWDSVAMLAMAWASRRDGDLSRAEAQARMAERMGAPVAERLELEAEILAARKRCDEAHARFAEALRWRAAVVFEDPLSRPLALGGWYLPPTLVSGCRVGVEPLAPDWDEAVTRP